MRIVFRGKLGGGLARRLERGGGKQRGLDWSIRRERRESVLLYFSKACETFHRGKYLSLRLLLHLGLIGSSLRTRAVTHHQLVTSPLETRLRLLSFFFCQRRTT